MLAGALTLSTQRFTYPTLAIFFLVALRIAIGWYFFESGREKRLDRTFSSAGFLSQATGPFAELYKANLPDYHQFRTQMAVAQEDTPNPHDPDTDPWRSFNERSYADWLVTIINDWGGRKDAYVAHFGFDAEQSKKALGIFDFYEGRLRDHFATNQEDIDEYRHELYRLQKWQQSSSAESVPFQAERVALKRAEIAGKAAEIQAAVREIEAEFELELRGLARSAQLKQHGDSPREPHPLARTDLILIYSHYAIGACLVVGLFTRLASLGAGCFLLLVIGSQLPWIVGYSTIGNQIVMMCGCFLLTATAAGRWCGLDYFVHKLITGTCCRGNKGAADASE